MKTQSFLAAGLVATVVVAGCSSAEQKPVAQTTPFEEQLAAVLPIIKGNNTLKVMQKTGADGTANVCFAFTTRANNETDPAARAAEVPTMEEQLARVLPIVGDKYDLLTRYDKEEDQLLFCLSMRHQDKAGVNDPG